MALNILVLGAGAIGTRHFNNLTSLGVKAELQSYRSITRDQLADKLGAFQGVVIATATQIRLEVIAACADAGLPFYVEKPLAWSADQVAEIFAAAAPVAQRSMVGYMTRYHPAFQALAGLDLSDIYGFQFEIGHDVRQWRKNWSFATSYAALPQGGGVLLDLCHELDMAQCLFPQAALQRVDSLGHGDFPGVDFATRISLAGPQAAGSVAMDYLSPHSLRRISLRGQKQVHDLDMITMRHDTHSATGTKTTDFSFERNDMFLALMRDFLALVEGKQPSQNAHMPRFDLVRPSCTVIANAWTARHFNGTITGDYT